MSRHKTVKAMSDAIVKSQPVDDEYEYYDEEDGEEEYDPDAAEQQMREAVSAARTILGEDFSESEIRESLWHYYYDVDKTVNYLLKQRTASQDKTAPKKAKGWLLTDFSSPMPPSCASVNRHPRSAASSTALVGRGSIAQDADPPHVESPGHLMAGCGRALTAAEFFKDSPWLNIPMERRSEILVEPLHPRGGLLGGSSQGTGKPSKLAALAAARKKKENDKASTDSKGASNSLALLDKLGTKPKASETKASTETSYESSVLADQTKHQESAPKPRKYPVRQKMQEVQKPASKPEEINTISTVTPVAEPTPEPPVLTSPSHFAQAMIGGSSSKAPSSSDSEPHLTRYTVFPENNAENPFAGPSPDDIVSKAQSASKGLKSGKAQANKDKTVGDLAKDLNKAKIDDTPRAKSKNLDVIAEYDKSEKKNAANFVVIGHVDAGKSTLMGRLLADLGAIDQRTLDKYKKEAENIGKASFALAWVLDESAEERDHGVTIDIATRRFDTSNTAFTILDAPGHQDFVPNMIAGTSQADFAVLLVDASKGSFESGMRGQTKEHALLARALGVQRMVVAVNKLDSVEWQQSHYDDITQEVSGFLVKAGFQEANISYVPCSGLNGENITKRSTDPASKWYTGPILLEQLEDAAVPRSYDFKGPLRMPIFDIFSGGVQFPLSTAGRLTSGSVQVGDKILCAPSNDTGYIKAIEVDGELKDWAVAGMNVTLHLSHVDPTHLKTGDVICSPSNALVPKTSFMLKALAFSHITPMYLSVHVGRLDVEGRVEALLATMDKTGEIIKKKPKIVKPGSWVKLRVVIEAEGGLPIEEGARVVLRAEGETLAAGLIE